MARNSTLTVSVGIIAAVMTGVAVSQASDVFAPLALALFIIALIWPLQSWLQARMPALLALAMTMAVTVAVCIAFASLVAWGFGRVGVSLLADTARYQALYERAIDWLDDRGISVAGLWSEHFNVGWLVHWAGQITGRVNTTLTFWLIALLYVILGLMEVDVLRRRAQAYLSPESARILLQGSAATAVKIRKYMEVRTLMSVATGVLVGLFAWIAGLPFALEWAVIAFALNYIPFIGPFVATLFPTLVAMTQFEVVASGRRRLRLPQHHPVRGRQLYRASRVRRDARHVAHGRAARRFLMDLSLGSVRRLHRRPDRHRDRHLLRLSPLEPLDRGPAWRAYREGRLGEQLGGAAVIASVSEAIER